MKILTKEFDHKTAKLLRNHEYGSNWPVVYILKNKKEAYIGETTSINNRLKQHLESNQRKYLKEVKIIADDTFHKSAVLDIEAKLIEYMSADNTYILQNSNAGMRNHDYYQKEFYQALFKDIWKELKKQNIVKNELEQINNSDLFKYTPYKQLTEDQYQLAFDLVLDILTAIKLKEPTTNLINGEAGTGKTVLAMYILKLFADNRTLEFLKQEESHYTEYFQSLQNELANFKIALVVPMTSLRQSLKKVAKGIKGLKANMIIGPSEATRNTYDLLLVDEAHRLSRKVAITNWDAHNKANQRLGLGTEATELDWINASSKHTIFFYDKGQSIRPSDVAPQDFLELVSNVNYSSYRIQSQLRVLGGNDYIQYINNIFGPYPPKEKIDFEGYDLKLFDSVEEMKNQIISNNNKFGLSRLVAGYAWKWISKGKSLQEIQTNNLYDIVIDDSKFYWNTNAKAWPTSPNAINEVGGIYTTQGYDLNYAGVIIGPDLKFNPKSKMIYIDRDQYFDSKGKQNIPNEDKLHDYIINAYKVLLNRGIRGTYIYVCDPNLKEYLSNYIAKHQD